MTLYLLPGMGADSSMYGGPWRSLDDVVFVDWPDCNGETTLSEVADRLISTHGIGPSDLIAGSSMGGMVALEVAEKVGIEKVILLGSAKSRDEVHPLLVALSPLAKITPLRFSQVIGGSSSKAGFAGMAIKTDSEFIKNMCVAVANWGGAAVPDDRICRIHGTKDRVIPCPEECHRVEGAGHLLAITHAEACVGLMNTCLASVR